jgi:hypothetical protein
MSSSSDAWCALGSVQASATERVSTYASPERALFRVCDDFILQPLGQVTDGVTIAAQTDALARLSFRLRLRGAQERFYVWQEDLPRGCQSCEHSFAITLR